MSDIIQLLPDSVANQIAAGEVIQRPASVVKELVENAVDAGAKNIKVLIVDAGRTSIQVIDDGSGMSDTDARLAFERHATSKISCADDLFSLHTNGFRGEALASIAAVARVELKTRLATDEVGTHISLVGSKVMSQETIACPVGSNFNVADLFFNVPARRKFLKSNATEMNNILTAFERIVLVYPEVSFSLFSNGTEMMRLNAGTLHKRISDVFGKRFNEDLLAVNVDTSIARITGFVGKPESARRKGIHEYLFVNGRYMKHPYFHKAVTTAFERLIPMGMHVPYFIYFNVPPQDIDVNIHPTKTEIKFENEQAIWQILVAAVRDAVGMFCDVNTIDFDTEGKPEIPVMGPSMHIAPPKVSYDRNYTPFGQTQPQNRVPRNWEQLFSQDFNSPQNDGTRDGEATEAYDMQDKSPTHYQYKERYIMTAVKSGLMVIDQHRADVRIRYERYLSMMETSTQGNSQQLLFPEVVTFSHADDVILKKILYSMTSIGFDLTDLGHGSYAINGVPAGMEAADYTSLLKAMVADAVEKGEVSLHEMYRTMALSMARGTAIPQGQVLDNAAMERIVNALFACSNVNYTPDGKTILAILPQREIEQLLD